MTKYSQEFIEYIISEYSSGYSVAELSRKYHIDVTTIRKWLNIHNTPFNGTDRFHQKYDVYDDFAEIYIKSNGGFVKAIIDIDDVDRCKNFGIWSLTKGGYVINYKNGMYLHRFIMNCPEGVEVDHIEHNTLDNRKSKLRLASSSQQKMNTRIRKDNKSGHRGVYYDKSRNTWNVHLKSGDKRIAKRFKNIDDAIVFCEEKMFELQNDFMYKGA